MKKTKKVGGENRPAKCFAYVPDPEKPDTWKLPIYNADGSVDKDRLPKAYAAMISNYRGEKAQVPASARAGVMAKIRAAYRKAGMKWPGSKSESDEPSLTDLFIEGEVLDLVEAEGETQSRVWEVVLIKPGLSKNFTYYSSEVLTKAAPLFEGAPALDRTDDQHSWDSNRSVKNILAVYKEVQFREGALRAKMHILADGDWLHNKMVEMRALGFKDPFGLSIVAGGSAVIKKKGGQFIRNVESIDRVSSVDPVINPAAGGRFIRLAAAEDEQLRGEIKMLKALLDLIEAKRPDLLKDKDLENLTEAEVLAMAEAAMLTEAEIEAAKKKEDQTATPPPNTQTNISEAERQATTRITEAEQRFECRMLLRDKLDAAKLPDPAKTRLRTMYTGKIFTEAELDKAIKDERDYLALFDSSGQVTGAGTGTFTSGLAERDKVLAGLDGFFFKVAQEVGGQKVSPFRSFKEAYITITGDRYLTGRLSEAVNLKNFTESLYSGSWAKILGDSITRKMVADYQVEDYLNSWRKIVSEISSITDFRSQKRMRLGGYGTLPDVAERGNYEELTSPGDEEANFAISKKGGTEAITLEMIANDDIGAIRRIPTQLSLAAKITLFKAVFDIFINNPTCTYDSQVLFHADHKNLGTDALSRTALTTLRQKLRDQKGYGNDNLFLALLPKFLLVPNELEELAIMLVSAAVTLVNKGTTEVSDMPNIHQGMEPIVLDYWTDAQHWYTVADPNRIPTIEVGFFQGREDPELFVKNQPEQDSMWSSDQLEFKLRHIWGLCLLDHRGFQANQP